MDNHHTTIFGSLIENGFNSAVMNELSPDGGWIESSDISYSTLLNLSSSYFESADTYMTCFDSNITSDETDKKKPLDDCHHDQFIVDRMIRVIAYLNERCIFDTDLLVQLWLPVIINGKRVLTTMNQHMVNANSANLSYYREVSKSYQFGAEFNSNELMSLPSRVFLNKFPMCTPDLQIVAEGNDPRVIYAQKFNLYGCLIIPIFEQDGETCLGVVELVTTSQDINFRDELENIFKALEIVDLKSSDFLIHPKIKDFNEPNEMALAEIRDVLRSICDTLKLPLAQTWGPSKSRSGEPVDSISILDSASYVFDPQMLGFFEACSLQKLVQGEGIAGKALGTNQPCFANIDDFCRADYPLAHQVRMFGLDGSLAIRLHSTYTGSLDFILEFFLPRNCNDHEEQNQMCNSIASMIQNLSWSLHAIEDEEQVVTPVKETNTRDESWISHMLEAKQRGENVVLSMGCHKEEPEEEFQLVNDYYNGLIFSETEKQTYLGWGPESRNQQSINKRSNAKNRSKTERNISLQVLQQYFPGSLKDAAKSIGVCPTTLKRICRQHGIMRWPSRKIKKVSHSLKKLQLVIDSVQGAEGVIQLGAFYTNFPELSSVAQPSPKPKVNQRVNALKSQTTTSNSSSSCSCGSSCSIGSHKRTKKVNGLVQEETRFVLTSESNKLVDNHTSPEDVAPAANNGSPISNDENVFRVKASYGDEKIRFKMPKTWGFELLKRELTMRFNIYDVGNIILEYTDDEEEWVLLSCDADLEECKEIHTSAKNPTIKLFLHQSSNSAFVPLIFPDDDISMW
ncbi:protein NLP1-like [Rutidosis leptorrhynchoides]|uniref:protein NLP1-like n=1 Tax=Rutidosis leptorrhynchoides TaxID=125765 RepID=UPI003A990A3A